MLIDEELPEADRRERRELRLVPGAETTTKAPRQPSQNDPRQDGAEIDQRRQAENARQQAERERDADYVRHRWLAWWRSENRIVEDIARIDGVTVDLVRAGLDQVLLSYTGQGLCAQEAERFQQRLRARAVMRQKKEATV